MDIPEKHVLLIGRHLENVIEEDEQAQIESKVYFAPDVPGLG